MNPPHNVEQEQPATKECSQYEPIYIKARTKNYGVETTIVVILLVLIVGFIDWKWVQVSLLEC